MGLLGIPFPEDEGGAGLDTLAYAIAVEELSRVWGSLGIIVAAHTSLGCNPLHLAGTDEQKQRYLVPMASRPGPRRLRPDRAGGRLRLRRHAHHGASSRTKRATAAAWVINGRKRFITNAGQAGTYIVTARTGDARRRLARDQRLHRRAAGTPGFCDRPARGEDGPPRQRHRRAALRGLPRSRPTSMLGEQGRGLEDLPEDPRRRPHLDRRHGRRACPRRRSTRRCPTPGSASSSAGPSARSRASPS